MKKIVIATVASLIVFTLATIFFVRIFSNKHVKTEIIHDSIIYHAGQAQKHKDSAEFHRKEYEEAWDKYIDVATINTDGWDSIRAKYKSDLEAKIRSGSTGLSDSLRDAETGGKQPAKVK